MLSRLNFPSTQTKSRFGENNSGLKQKNSRLVVSRECVGKPLTRKKIFDAFEADDSRNRKYFPSNRELSLPEPYSDNATDARS